MFKFSNLITDPELVELTGATRPSAQARWLDKKGIPYTLRRDGKPRTTWTAYDQAISGGLTVGTSPDFSCVS